MKKVLLFLAASALIICALSVFAFAGDGYVFDGAAILTDRQIASLNADAGKVYDLYGVRTVVLTSNTVGEDDVEDYADSFVYANYGRSSDVVIMFVSFCDNDIVVASYGESGYVFSKSVCDSIRTSVTKYLSSGDYERAFSTFIALCSDRQESYISDGDDDFDHGGDDPVSDKTPLLIGVLIGVGVSLIIAFSVAGSMKKKLKTANAAHFAQDYIVDGSLRLTSSRDTFLYSTTTRIPKPKSTSGGGSHGSSGGGGHSVSHGKF